MLCKFLPFLFPLFLHGDGLVAVNLFQQGRSAEAKAVAVRRFVTAASSVGPTPLRGGGRSVLSDGPAGCVGLRVSRPRGIKFD